MLANREGEMESNTVLQKPVVSFEKAVMLAKKHLFPPVSSVLAQDAICLSIHKKSSISHSASPVLAIFIGANTVLFAEQGFRPPLASSANLATVSKIRRASLQATQCCHTVL